MKLALTPKLRPLAFALFGSTLYATTTLASPAGQMGRLLNPADYPNLSPQNQNTLVIINNLATDSRRALTFAKEGQCREAAQMLVKSDGENRELFKRMGQNPNLIPEPLLQDSARLLQESVRNINQVGTLCLPNR